MNSLDLNQFKRYLEERFFRRNHPTDIFERKGNSGKLRVERLRGKNQNEQKLKSNIPATVSQGFKIGMPYKRVAQAQTLAKIKT